MPAAVSFAVGQRVKANYKNAGKWYRGAIDKALPDGSYAIKFDDGDYESGVPPHRVRPL